MIHACLRPHEVAGLLALTRQGKANLFDLRTPEMQRELVGRYLADRVVVVDRQHPFNDADLSRLAAHSGSADRHNIGRPVGGNRRTVTPVRPGSYPEEEDDGSRGPMRVYPSELL